MNNTVGRIKDQTLAQYIKTHDATEALETVKGDIHDKLDYVQQAMFGETGYDPKVARAIMGDLREGVKAMVEAPVEGYRQNAQDASAVANSLTQDRKGEIDGQKVELRSGDTQHTDGAVIRPEGYPVVFFGQEGDKATGSTVTIGDEHAGLSATAYNFETLRAGYGSAETRPGLDGTMALVNDLTPQIQGILT
ncbi:MAG TPA: hypothetical protein VGO93_26065, partial [Candidatus Xenobia bacterium]